MEVKEKDEAGDRELRAGWRRWMGFGLVILGLAMVAGFALYVVSLLSLVDEQGVQIGLLKEEVGRNQEVLRILSSDDLDLVHLTGPAGRDGWRGTLLRDRGSRSALLQINGITAADTGTRYHLWIVGKDVPVSIKGFTVKPESSFSLFVEKLPEPEGGASVVVVTTDPGGKGSFKSGALVLAGSIPK